MQRITIFFKKAEHYSQKAGASSYIECKLSSRVSLIFFYLEICFYSIIFTHRAHSLEDVAKQAAKIGQRYILKAPVPLPGLVFCRIHFYLFTKYSNSLFLHYFLVSLLLSTW